uniref:Uncharacterized protein n=1 Tax=Scleropages formosus TaxID=113540 RepID=A0A8C9TV89_SCLFO
MEIVRLLDWSNLGSVVFFGLLFLFFSEMFRIRFFQNKLPPGPKPFPFVGNLPQIIKSFCEKKCCSFHFGREPSIVLNTIDVVKEALVHNASEFSGRPYIPVIDWVTNGKGIVTVPYGTSWRQQRRFALQTLRNFGLGKKSLEERVSEEARYLIEELEKHKGKSFDPQHCLQNAVANIICSIVFGNRFDYDNKRFGYFLEITNRNFILAGSPVGQITNFLPFIKYLPGPQQNIKRNANKLLAFFEEAVKEHKSTLDRENLRDFIDTYLVEIEAQKSNPESTFSEENMIMTVADLFFAGTDTTATTLRWGLIFMMEHPDIQEKCHQEIVQVLGYDRLPTMDDRANMHYVHATVHEIQRFANIVPLGVVHSVTKDTQLRGYHLAEGTQVFVNMTAILTDKDHWKFPYEFNPGNFLNDEGKFFRHEAFLAFSLGPRVCLGEQLARMELFIFFVSLIQHLKFIWPPGVDSYDRDGIFGIVRGPRPFMILCHSQPAIGSYSPSPQFPLF